jgi:hypothetical protein
VIKIKGLTESRTIMNSRRPPALRLTLAAPVGSLLEPGEEQSIVFTADRLGRSLLALEKT